jgi:dTDP-4-amino-4,6-dideoxygalactose transaminase
MPERFPKRSIADLAILGGPQAFGEQLHVGRPNTGDRAVMRGYFEDILDRRWLTNDGPYVRRLEAAIAARIGVKHCIAVCNATIGLQIGIRALGLRGEVIVPSFTFVATAHALEWQGITPVFCDVDPATHVLDPGRVVQCVSPVTTGILGVHVWGRPCAINALEGIARERGLRLLFDAAHAFGCSHGGRMIGNFGDLEVFSFHATKFLNTFEGGAIVTKDDALADRARLLRNFGFVDYDRTVSGGTNAKMPEMSAAMGLVNLAAMDDFIEVNRRNYIAYRAGLASIRGLTLAGYDEREHNNFQYIVVQVDPALAGISRDLIVKILHHENVLARRYFYPGCHQLEPYRSLRPGLDGTLPNTCRLTGNLFCLPTGTAVAGEHIEVICGLLRLVIAHSAEVVRQAGALNAAGWVQPRND